RVEEPGELLGFGRGAPGGERLGTERPHREPGEVRPRSYLLDVHPDPHAVARDRDHPDGSRVADTERHVGSARDRRLAVRGMPAMAAAAAHLEGGRGDAEPCAEHDACRGAQDPGGRPGAAFRDREQRIESGDDGRRQGEIDPDDLYAGHPTPAYRGSFTWRPQASMLCGWRFSAVVVSGSSTRDGRMPP